MKIWNVLRDRCGHPRDLAMIDLLISTGVRVGELVNLNRSDINFTERECIVLGKGDKERRVYLTPRPKSIFSSIWQPAVMKIRPFFVSLHTPWQRLSVSGVERFLTRLGTASRVRHVHPHKFSPDYGYYGNRKGHAH